MTRKSSTTQTVEALIKAASEEFAERGYEGTRIHNIVKRAGLTTGAVYRRFKNKNDLLHEAIVARAASRRLFKIQHHAQYKNVTEFLRGAGQFNYDLDDYTGMLLEAFVCARRVPEVAESIKQTHTLWVESVLPLIAQGMEDGSIDPELDPDALAVFFRIIGLGSMLFLSSHLEPPRQEVWLTIIDRVLKAIEPPENVKESTPS